MLFSHLTTRWQFFNIIIYICRKVNLDFIREKYYNKETNVAQHLFLKGCDIMPRNFMFTKEEIIAAAVSVTREKGFQALTARALGERLGSSPKPIFGLFENMAEVQKEVLNAA